MVALSSNHSDGLPAHADADDAGQHGNYPRVEQPAAGTRGRRFDNNIRRELLKC